MGLIDELRKNDKKNLFTSDDLDNVSFKTGFKILDYANGYWKAIKDEKTNTTSYYPMVGIPRGSLCSIIGETGGGKSTLATQMGWNIVKDFDNGLLFIIDCEKSHLRDRIARLTHTDIDEPRITLNKSHTTIEEVLMMFNSICDLKANGGTEYMYEIKLNNDSKKGSVWQYIPTVFIVDSLPKFNSSEYNAEDLGTNMDQARAAKDITRFVNNILDKSWKYNIIWLFINHIRPKLTTNVFTGSSPRELLVLNGATETLPRGAAVQYLSNIYYRIRTGKKDIYTIETDGFTGAKCQVQIAKSRTNVVGTSYPLTFNYYSGFDPIMTEYEYAKSLDLITGKSPFLYFRSNPDMKFSKRTFVEKYHQDEEFRKVVDDALAPHYYSLLGDLPENAVFEPY